MQAADCRNSFCPERQLAFLVFAAQCSPSVLVTEEKIMHERERSWVLAACVAAAMPFVSSAAVAEATEGSKDIVCAVIDVVACAEQGPCIQGQARDFDLHEMLIVDVEEKIVHATRESEDKAVSPVKNMETSGSHLIVQGVENGRGWSFAIDTATGRMSGSGVGDALSFLVFGTCTAN